MRSGATVQGSWSVERGAWSVRASRLTPRYALRSTLDAPRSTAFTLIELMVVIGIMAIVMTISAPSIYRIWHQESIRQSVKDVTDACEQARSLAIMRGTVAEIVFHADGGRFEVHGGAPAQPTGDSGAAAVPVSAPAGGVTGSPLSGVLPDTVGIAALKVNGVNCMDIDEAHVRFYPNGTCDELRLVLLDPKNGDMRGIYTEVTTGLVSLETDKFKLQSELR